MNYYIKLAPVIILMLTYLDQGLSQSPGVPSLEYLGIGYNAITGNPRGTESSNIDPGFRASVIKLINDQDVRTVDTRYTVPLGTELRYITSCEYSSEAVQVSSSATYQRQLRKTATSSNSKTNSQGTTTSQEQNVGVGVEVEAPIKNATVSAGVDYGYTWGDSKGDDFTENDFFSQSESYQKEVALTQETELSSFEAQGVCAEFEVALKKYHKQALHDSFLAGLVTLPVPYAKDDVTTKKLYLDFISEYGTHYINRVTLGAKTVITTFISKNKVGKLEDEGIDVSTTLNFKSLKGETDGESDGHKVSANVGAELHNASGTVKAEYGNTVIINNYDNTTIERGNESNVSEKETNVKKVSASLQNTYEFNVGGLPAVGGDWKEWARSVRENPMPISYDVSLIYCVSIVGGGREIKFLDD
jgi:hypothetical protein